MYSNIRVSALDKGQSPHCTGAGAQMNSDIKKYTNIPEETDQYLFPMHNVLFYVVCNYWFFVYSLNLIDDQYCYAISLKNICFSFVSIILLTIVFSISDQFFYYNNTGSLKKNLKKKW